MLNARPLQTIKCRYFGQSIGRKIWAVVVFVLLLLLLLLLLTASTPRVQLLTQQALATEFACTNYFQKHVHTSNTNRDLLQRSCCP